METVAGKGTGTEMDAETRDGFFNLVVKLGDCGMVLVLFETLSGFAIFSYDGLNLFRPKAIESIWADFVKGYFAKSQRTGTMLVYISKDQLALVPKSSPFLGMVVWLKEYKHLENMSSAIHPVTGVDEDLAMMIRKYIVPGQKLAVGKPEYKSIIEDKLEISCLYDETVMELMWGLTNCIQYLMPSKNLELPKDDCLRMSKGMKTVLDRYNLKVEPEMVNEHIIETTAVVYNCDHFVNKHGESLRAAGEHLKKISNIDTQNWGLVKLAIALKIICYPEEKLPGNPLEAFSAEEYSKLVKDAPRYQGKLLRVSCKIIFEEMLSVRRHRNRMLRLLAHYVREARKAYDAGQALISTPSKKRKSLDEAAINPREKVRWPLKLPQRCH